MPDDKQPLNDVTTVGNEVEGVAVDPTEAVEPDQGSDVSSEELESEQLEPE